VDPRTVDLRLTLATTPPRDVVVRAPVGTTLAQLTERLDGGRDGGPRRLGRWSVDGVTVSGEHVLGRPPMVDGCRLRPPGSLLPRPTEPTGPTGPTGRPGPTGQFPTGQFELHVVAGPQVGHRLPVRSTRTSVGRDPGNDLVLDDVDVSRHHLELALPSRGDHCATVRDLLSSNGSQVITPGSGERHDVSAAAGLAEGDLVQLGGSRIAVRPVAPAADLRPDDQGHLLVNRAPYPARAVVEAVVTVPNPPTQRPGAHLSWPMVALPLVFAVPAAWWWHQPMLLLMGLLSPATALAQFVTDRRRGRREHRRADAAYRAALAEADDELRVALRQAARHAWQRHPDPAEVAAVAAHRDQRLWRSGTCHDPLTVRVGTADQKAPVVRRTPDGPEPATLVDAPATIDLTESAVLGICGPRGPVRALARSLVGQAAVWCSPADLAITVVSDEARAVQEWGWTAWLPHASGRLPPPGDSTTETRGTEPQGGDERRHLVVLDAAVRDHPEVGPLLSRPGRAVVVCLAPSRAQLPRQCRTVLTVTVADAAGAAGSEHHGTLEQPGAGVLNCRLELPRLGWAWRLARDLAPLRDGGTSAAGSGLPDRVRLLDLVDGGADPAAVARRWLTPDARGLGVPLGATEAGVWRPDLVGDGPHALVAGTTGAGKSELLTSLVASLALHHSPQALSLLLVDYKGGTAFGRLVELPHVTGVVTDLDGVNAHRVLSSLTAELRRREAALADARGAEDADQRLLELGRLVVVVDEFRVLAEEQPDVLAALVRVATVGRGLGVHLVLATQRPAGVVSGEVRANVALRVALRVRDRTDSDDVVDAPHAARLGADRPGRAWVRDASGALFAVQTAHLPAAAGQRPPSEPDDVQWAPLRIDPRMPSHIVDDLPAMAALPPQDDLGQVVLAVRAAAKLLGRPPARAAWLPPLPTHLTWSQLAALSPPEPEPDPDPGPALDHQLTRPVVLPFALADLPHRQQQRVMAWRLPDDGHLAVSGGPGSGRSSVARTIAFAAVAAGLEVHVVEGSPGPGPALGDWVSGTVVPAADVDRTVRLVRHLARRAAASPSQDRPTVLVVDGWEGLEQTWSRAGWPQGPDELQALARDGTAAGLRLVVTGGRALLSGSLAAVLSERLLLRTADPATALLAGVATNQLPSPWPNGRILRIRGPEVTSAQVALLEPMAAPPTDPMAAPPTDPMAAPPKPTPRPALLRLAPLPLRVGRDMLPRAHRDPRAWLGLGGDDATPLALPRAGAGCLVTGGPGSGRTATLATLAHALVETGRRIVVVTAAPENPWWPTGPTVATVARRGSRLLTPVRPDPDQVLLLDDGWLSVTGLDDLGMEHLGDSVEQGPLPEPGEADATATPSRLRVVAAVTGGELTVAFRGLVAALRDGGVGIVLGARSWAGDPFAGSAPAPGSPPGRGLLVQADRRQPVQVAFPSSAPCPTTPGQARTAARLTAVRTPA
jgi:DNA segregation ATPase FtsK/SpoIIIE, S-DNA-T family